MSASKSINAIAVTLHDANWNDSISSSQRDVIHEMMLLMKTIMPECVYCNGEGVLDQMICPKCEGAGYIYLEEKE